MSSIKAALIFAAALLVGGIVVPASSASASEFCYEMNHRTTPVSHPYHRIVVHLDVSWSSLFNCSGQRIGVKVYSYQFSYTGGFNGIDDLGSQHGIVATGIVYLRDGECCGIWVSPDAEHVVAGFPRYASDSKPGGWEVYSVRDREGVNRSFAETVVGGSLKCPNGPQPCGLEPVSVAYNLLSNKWFETNAIGPIGGTGPGR